MIKHWLIRNREGNLEEIRQRTRPVGAIAELPEDLYFKPISVREEEFTLTEFRQIPDSEGREPEDEGYEETLEEVPVLEEFLVPDPEGREPGDEDYERTVESRPIVRTRLIPELDAEEEARREAERQAIIDAENAARAERQAKINLARRAREARNLEELKEMVQALTDVLLGGDDSGQGNSQGRN